MIFPFIISTSLFFLFLLFLSVRSFLLSKRVPATLLFAAEGSVSEDDDGGRPETITLSSDGRADAQEDEYKENIYKGILWMKEKYEQYRDLADERYERLKEQLTKMEKKYEDLVASVGSSASAGAVVVPVLKDGTEEPMPVIPEEPGGVESWGA